MKEDVTSPEVIERWCEELDYRRVIPLVATRGDRIIGDATLHRSRSMARRHVADVRVVVDPEYRNKGVGRGLLRCLGDVAGRSDVARLRFEVVAGREEPARRTGLRSGSFRLPRCPITSRTVTGRCMTC